MTDLWVRFWEHAFYQNALCAGVAVALACGLLSVPVVWKKMAFIGQGVSHAAFGGVGLALVLQLYFPLLSKSIFQDGLVAVFCICAALVVGGLAKRRRITEDSAIGICLAASMAIGVILLNVRTILLSRAIAAGSLSADTVAYTPSFHDILFGNILSISSAGVMLSWAVTGIVFFTMFILRKEMGFFCFDEEAAWVFGVPVRLLRYCLLVLLGMTVVVAMRLLGVILCSALLIVPSATANLWSRRIDRVAFLSILFAVASVVLGLFLSMLLRYFSTGPVIALTLIVIFVFSYVVTYPRRGR